MLIVMLILGSVGALFGACSFDGVNNYDEGTMEEYANTQYASAFSDTADYEGNILLVFTVYEDYNGYETIAFVGYNLSDEIQSMYGDEFTKYGQVVLGNIPDYYEYSLSNNLKSIVNKMADNTAAYSTAEGDVDTSHSKLINNSSLKLSETTVNDALVAFTERTGIPISIVVVDGAQLFGESNTIVAILLVIVAIILVVVLIKMIRNYRSGKSGGGSGTTSKTDPNAGQGKYDPNTGTYTT